jgi:hypothetical protein
MGYVAAAVVVVVSVVMPTLAWGIYRVAGAETNTFATHVLVAPAKPTCSLISLLTLTINWTAPTDASFIDGYEWGVSASSTGPFTYTDVNMATSASVSVPSLGTRYFVVHTTNHSWLGADSVPRQVVGLTALATCP